MNEETIFAEALALPEAERAAYLDAVCAGQPELRQRIEALLQAHEAGSLLNPPAADPDPTGDAATADYHPAIEPGVVIAGRYTLVQKIGEGGMGEVWLAKQTEPVKRKVALKLIKAGLDSRAVVARFENERQALAMMDHPNIARVLDGGLTPSGQPFFVMELVNGLALSKFCDQARLSLRERLELFVPICQAVQHAHYKGIVHRDLKPANILVTLIDARPVPKVIDFGVAKATGGKLTDESLATQFGAIVGTLEYLSPEQAGYSGLDIDTRADIYSLGVILYELLTGLRPIDAKRLKKAAFTEMIRMIQEEEPSKPSTRLSTDEALPSLAALRQTEPRRLMALLRGELDWVVMKCLEKQRERRYTTANSLAAEIQRYLADEAVEARPPSAAYRLSKFLKRHKGPVMAACLLLLALLGGIAGTTWGMIRADHARAAEAERVTERDAALTKLTASEDELLSSMARSLLRPLALQVRPNQWLPPLNDPEVEALWELASSKDERLRLRFVEVALQDPVSTRRLKDRAGFALHAVVGLNGMRGKQIEDLLGKRLQANEMLPDQQVDIALCVAQLGILDRPLAGKTAAILIQAMSKTTNWIVFGDLSQSLSVLTSSLEPKEAVFSLTQAMTMTTDSRALEYLSQGLSKVATRMEPEEAVFTLTQAMTKTTDSRALGFLTVGLSAVVIRLEPKEIARVCGQGAVTLTQAMRKTTDCSTLENLVQALLVLASRIERKESAQVCGQAAVVLTLTMNKTTDPKALPYLANSLSAVAFRMEPKEAAKACGKAATMLTQVMSKEIDPDALRNMAQGLSAVAAWLEAQENAKACGQAAVVLTQTMSKTTEPITLWNLAKSLSALASRLEPKEAAQACGRATLILVQAMGKTTDPIGLSFLLAGVLAMADGLEPKEAAGAAFILTHAMGKTKEPFELWTLAKSLLAVAFRLEQQEAAKVCAQAAVLLTQAISKATDPGDLGNLAQGLLPVASRLDPEQATRVRGQAITALTQAMGKTTDSGVLRSLSESLSGLASRLELKEAAKACGNAAATLIQVMNKAMDPDALENLAQGLSAVAAWLEPQEAAKACGQAAGVLTQAMNKTTDPIALWHLTKGLSVVASRLEPKEATVTLTQAMSNMTSLGTLENLAQGLSAVAFRLEPKEAVQACGQAAVALTKAMSNTTEPEDLMLFSEGLSAIAFYLEPKVAAQACGQTAAALIQAMSKTTKVEELVLLAKYLLAVLSRQPPTTLLERYTSAMATVATLGGLGLPFTPLASAQRALEPLPPQTLVDILKQPFCVGEARRLVLEQLSRHYHRPFADQWEFVDYVHQHKLALDLTTPPHRPAD